MADTERARMRSALESILEEAEDHENVRDGSDGRPRPNDWMVVAALCRAALGGQVPGPTLETERVTLVMNEDAHVPCQGYTDTDEAVRALAKFRAASPEVKFSLISTVVVRGREEGSR